MSILANAGPLVIMRGNTLGSVVGTGSQNQNPDEAINLEHLGSGILDPRVPYTYQPGMGQFVGGLTVPGNPAFYGFLGGDYITIDAVPAALAANNIAASQSPGAGAITLVSASAAGVTTGVSITRADTGALVTGLLALDGVSTGYPFGMSGTVNAWNPATLLSRTLRFVSGGNDSGITFTVTGFDAYGYPMSETITGANATTANGAKAWKYIQSITHTGSVATTLTIGTNDVFGLPLRSDTFSDVTAIFWNNAWTTASTGYTAAVLTNPSTATTGDVRGTYAVQGAASNGTLRLTIYQAPKVQNIGGGQLQTFTVTNASPAVFTLNGHGFVAGQPLQFITTAALPTGLLPGTTYYVISAGLTTNNFEVSTVVGGPAVNTSSAGSGTHSAFSFATSNFVVGMFGVQQNTSTNNGY